MRFLLFSALLTLSCTALATEAVKHYEHALQLLNEDKLAEAEIAVKNSLQQDLDYLPARLLLGNILLKTGNLKSAEKEFEQAKILHADSYAVTMSLVEVKLLLDKNEEALALLTAQKHLNTDAQYYYFQGNAYKALLKYDLALSAYQQAINMQENSAQYHTALADLWYRNENTDNAQQSLNKALLIDDTYIPALLLNAELYKKLNQYQQAQQFISLVLSLDEHNKQALFSQAGLYLAQNELALALAITLKLRESSPYDPYAKLLHSSIVAQQGNTKQARIILSEVKQQLSGVDNRHKDDQDVLLLSATVDFINQNSHSAKKQFVRYLDLYGENSSARRYLAILALREQDIEKAQFHIEKALAKNSNDVEMYVLASEIYRQAGLLTQQLTLLEKANKNFPDNKRISEHYIASLLANEQQETALAELSKTNTSGSATNEKINSSLQNKTVLGFMQLQAGLFEQAQQTTQALLNEYPDKVEVLQLAGELSLKTRENSEEAIYFFEQALALDANFSPAILSLAGVYLQQKKLTEVESYYQQLLTINPNNALALQLYADLAVKQGRFPLAIKLLTPLAANNNFQTGRALLNLYIATKQPDLALPLLTQLEQGYPLNEALLLTKSRIQAQLGEQAQAQKSLNILYGLLYEEPKKLIVLAGAQLDVMDANAAAKTIARIQSLEQDPIPPLLQTRLYIAQQQYKKALTIIDSALQENENSRSWLSLKVNVLINQEQFEQATLIVEELYQDEKRREQLQLLAQLYSQQEKTEQLITLLVSWLEHTPSDKWAVAQLSTLAEMQGDLALAITTLENYPNLDTNPAFLNNLANYHLAKYLKEVKKEVIQLTSEQPKAVELTVAINHAQKAYELMPLNAAINDTLGWLHVQTGNIEQGLGLLREASARDAQNGEIYYHLAYALTLLERKEQAYQAYQKATSLLPQHKLRSVINELLIKIKS
ncbi:PEP-CTERM system TPR-repeat protein PrsT [Colwellia sp. D2M02]|uniref:XrtA/PEP-CTERM system TPR-repeat protein PrsT n=1 Tax=Colwellia sp. D2M02 TaxID=2841562 RepID=UPI001C09D2E2|nr:XrtA/PEP-CTERM system TPR-repeat protein PrsT [Colwellia sp. D2M02]MBU2894046.1 PEP-CTERM system TPR-repeat protein PrsT [Colwellia sp. D2M02]